MGKTYWMLVTSQENLDITRARGFSLQGVDTKNRRKAVRMGPEDRVLYYVSDKKGFAATATVTSESFEDDEAIWKHHREQEKFPHRVEIEPDVVLEQERYVDGYQVGPTMEYVRKWPPDRWPLAFYGMLHIIPQRDFNFVEEELKRVGGGEEAAARYVQDGGGQDTEVTSEEIPENSQLLKSQKAGAEGSILVDDENESVDVMTATRRRSRAGSKSRKSSHRRRVSRKRR